ncbi:Ig-like domain-containing protein [Variovorax sp.]|uniref:Ig-like domain-containing protein n=1 Tax=Variovorax sp. TaxID=1871043 RepID=UPI002D53E96E|nr:Ig-like domain-containing protein [Variovorax sp.]HYP85148.1 Ig-like domain-containing protein [Variovorax sp.]
MSSAKVNVAVESGHGQDAVHQINGREGDPVRVRAQEGVNYLLEGEDGQAPENITLRRVGQDLEIMVEGEDQPGLVIEGYFEPSEPPGLYGVDAEGQLHAFVRTDGDGGIFTLVEAQTEAAALSGRPADIGIGGDGSDGGPFAVFLPLLVVGGLMGLAAYSISSSDDSATPRTDAPDAIDGVNDDVGTRTGPLASGSSTDDSSPEIRGHGWPGSTIKVYDNGQLIGETVVDNSGNWRVTPAGMADGAHSVTVTETRPGATESAPSAAFDFNVDTGVPHAPQNAAAIDDAPSIVGPIANGAATDDATPALSGTAEAGAVVVVRDNGEVIGSTAADAAGNWHYTPTLADGEHAITTTATDPAGNTSAASDPIVITVDTQAPAATQPIASDDAGPLGNGATTSDTTPSFSGQAEAGSTVEVLDGGQKIGEVVADPNGNWSYTPALDDGDHSITTQVVDPAGNKSAPSDPVAITIDSNPETAYPSAPAINSVIDNVGEVHALQKGESTDDNTPTMSGSAQPGAVVRIHEGSSSGQELGSVVAGADGQWTFTPEALPDGQHSLVAVATDPEGRTGPATGGWDFTVDTTAPAASSNGTATDDQGDQTGPIAPGGTTDDSTPTFSGDVEPGSEVVIEDNGVAIGTATVDDTGHWGFTPEAPLEPGDHEIVPVVVDPAGNQTPSAPINVNVDPTEVPVAMGQVLDNQGAVTGDISMDGVTDDTTPEFTGVAKAGSVVTLTDGQAVLGSTTAEADGSWRFLPPQDLAEGAHSVVATAVDPQGNSTESSAFGFSVDTLAPEAPTVGKASDDVGSVQGDLSSGAHTDDPTPTFSGTAEPGSTVTIKDNGAELGTVVAGDDGSWAFTPEAPLGEGAHTITTVTTDPAGNESQESGPFEITTDYTPPAGSANDGATDDAGDQTGPITSGGTTDDTTPTFSGDVEPGSEVIIEDNGVPIGTATVDDNGHWEFTPQPPLDQGPHNIVPVVLDPVGNETPGDPIVVNVLPAGTEPVTVGAVTDDQAPVTGNVAAGGVTNDKTPEFSGTASPGAVVTLTDGATTLGSATADSDGKWTIKPTQDMSEGAHNVVATVVDSTGNSTASPPFAITTDYTPPAPSANGQAHDDAGDQTGPITSGGTTDDTTPTFSGNVEPGSEVIIEDNGVPIGTATVDDNGHWEYTPPPLDEGSHSIVPVVVDAAGNQTSSDPIVVNVVPAGTEPVTVGAVTDDQAPVTGNVAAGGVTNDKTPEFSGTASPGAVVTLTDGATTLGSATADSDGKWTIKPTQDMSEGAHNVVATAVDSTGNSMTSPPFAITTDYTPPDAGLLGITGVHDDEGPSSGNVASGATTDDTTPMISGTGTAGDVVIVAAQTPEGERVLGSATVQADGTWSLQVENAQALPEGTNTFVALELDSAGNRSDPSAAYTINVNTDVTPIGGQAMIDLDSASDSGASPTDNVTNVAHPMINGSVTGLNAEDMAEVNAGRVTATLFDDANNNGLIDSGETVFASDIAVTADGASGARFNAALPQLQDGSYNIKSVLFDVAGNASAAGLLDNDPAARLVIDHSQPSSIGQGGAQNEGLGWVTHTAGDFNGDGVDDFIVSGTHNQDGTNDGRDNSKIYIVYGGANGLPQIGDMDAMTPAQGVKLDNTAVNLDPGNLDIGKTGVVLTSLGDINGDGYDDVSIASHREDGAYIVFGRETGTDTIHLREMVDGPTADGFRMGWGGAWFGAGVGGGDFNGDGYADIVVSDSADNRAFVLYGHEGAAGSQEWGNLRSDSSGVYNRDTGEKLSNASVLGSNGANGLGVGDQINSVGDVNNDGYDDFVLTHSYTDVNGQDNAGAAYLIFGSSEGLPSSITLDTDYGSYGIRLTGTEAQEYLGDTHINWPSPAHGGGEFTATENLAALGDINGDGFDDFIIGSPNWGDGASDGEAPGRAYVIYGKAGGWSDIELTNLDGSNGFYLESVGLGTDASLGSGVSGNGDVNGDGLADFLVGAPSADTNGLTNNGAVYLVYGQAGNPFANNPHVDLDALVAQGLARRWDGEQSDAQMGTGSGLGDWDGDGLAEIAIGSWKGDYDGLVNNGKYEIYDLGPHTLPSQDAQAPSAGVQRLAATGGADPLDGGAGLDGLVFQGAASVDLSALGGQVQGIEMLDAGSGNSNLALSGDGAQPSVYTSGNAELLVEDKVQVAIL